MKDDPLAFPETQTHGRSRALARGQSVLGR